MATTMATYPCAELRADYCGSTNNLRFTANLMTTWHYSCVTFHARKIFLLQGALPCFSPPKIIVMHIYLGLQASKKTLKLIHAFLFTAIVWTHLNIISNELVDLESTVTAVYNALSVLRMPQSQEKML